MHKNKTPHGYAYSQPITARIIAIAVSLIIACALCVLGLPRAAHAAEANAATLTLESNTSSTITADSGYHITLTITNTGTNTLDPGQLRVVTDPQYTFNSSQLLQQWAEGQRPRELHRLYTLIGSQEIPSLEPGAHSTFTIHTQANDPVMQLFTSWGAKPVMAIYDGTDAGSVELHTFVTRTTDGLHIDQTPAMNIVPVLPVTAQSWSADSQAITSLTTTSSITEAALDTQQSDSSNQSSKQSGSTKSPLSESSSQSKTQSKTQTNTDASKKSGADTSHSPGKSNSSSASNSATSDGTTSHNTNPADSSEGADSTKKSGTTESGNTPSTAQHPTVDLRAVNALVAQVARVSTTEQTNHAKMVGVSKRHTGLQSIIDPDATYAFTQPMTYSGVMQPSNTDIAYIGYAAQANLNQDILQQAGITAASCTAQLARTTLSQTTDTDNSNALPALAWQRQLPWSASALDFAKMSGYQAVVATSGYYENTPTAVATSKTTVHTSHGDIAVLTPQQELSALASDQATSASATAEYSSAGRLNRFVAQSATYQMEQPYVSRTLLVVFDSNTSSSTVDSMMTAIEQSSWLHISSIHDLINAEDGLAQDVANARAQQLQADQDTANSSNSAPFNTFTQTVKQLAQARNSIMSFADNILDLSAQTSDSAQTSGSSKSEDSSQSNNSSQSSNSAQSENSSSQSSRSSGSSQSSSGSNSSSTSGGSTSDQSSTSRNSSNADSSSNSAGADQNADTLSTADVAQIWTDGLVQAHHVLAMRALGTDSSSPSLIKGALRMSNELFSGVSIAKPEALNVVSQSAKMPVTVSNNHPYPVTISLQAATDSSAMQVETSQPTLTIPANSEEQTTVAIRIIRSGRSTLTLNLRDRAGQVFGQATQTSVSSYFQINDWSGYAILALATLLGVLGLWRQFHRVKDPDE